MKTLIVAAALVSALAVAGCRANPSGELTPTGTGTTPSGGIVPAQTPE